MTNFQVYKKTLPFSFIRFGADLLALAVLAGLSVSGFFIGANAGEGMGLLGLLAGLLVGLILLIFFTIFVGNRLKAAQIAMMTRGVTTGDLGDHTVRDGLDSLKGRFGKITVFFFITGAIRQIFNQIGRAFNKVGRAVGGNVGGGITDAINSAVQTLISYLCDCCLGWILFRDNVNPFRAGCEGCAIFFKNGKALLKNVGRIFGLGFLSFVLIGGALFGAFYGLSTLFPDLYTAIVNEMTEIYVSSGDAVPDFFSNPMYVQIIFSAFLAIILWSMIHSVVGRPFILVGVLRNFMEVGQKDLPQESDFAAIASKAPGFKKLQNRIS